MKVICEITNGIEYETIHTGLLILIETFIVGYIEEREERPLI